MEATADELLQNSFVEEPWTQFSSVAETFHSLREVDYGILRRHLQMLQEWYFNVRGSAKTIPHPVPHRAGVVFALL